MTVAKRQPVGLYLGGPCDDMAQADVSRLLISRLILVRDCRFHRKPSMMAEQES